VHTVEQMVDIQRLDEATVERIAAGEVVERPASVVKELVENSLDADASRVDVRVDAGGTGGIVVSDDGFGMTEAEARRAVDQHTTSKISDIDDLEGGVGTLGFRGEALHAIGAVSRMTITTRPRDGGTGTELRVEGGDVTGVDTAGCPTGTTVEIADLFYNVPARRKYLKQDATEFSHVNTVVTSYALANPDVALSLTHDGRETFATTGQGDRREAVMSVYGREVADAMIDVEARVATGGTDDSDPEGSDDGVTALPDGPLDAVEGLVSHPETNRSSREYLGTYVNGRYVTADAVRDAVVSAYGNQLAPDRYPFAVLFLDVPAGDVDVNVHPRKLDVRFADEDGVREQIRTAVESALLEAGLLRSSAPRGKSALDQTEIAPERDDDTRPAEAETATASDRSANRSGPDQPASEQTPDRSDGRGRDVAISGADIADGDPGTTADSGGATDDDPVTDATADSGGVTDDDSVTDATADAGVGSSPSTGPSTDSNSSSGSADGGSTGSGDRPAESDGRSGGMSSTGRSRSLDTTGVSGDHEQARLTEDGPTPDEAFETLPGMRVLGQFDDTYVVAESPDGLLLIDQHAADERINYERLRDRFAGETTTQALAEPVTIDLTAREAELFESFSDALATLGFQANRSGDRTVEVRTVPSLVAEAADPDLLRDVLASFVSGDRDPAETVEAAADELLADLACYPSITGNTSLTEGSIRELLTALDDCENPWACPHGRPVVIELDTDEIEARFERDYPGHGG